VVGGSVKFPARFINKPKTKGERNQKRERKVELMFTINIQRFTNVNSAAFLYTLFLYTYSGSN